MEGEHWELLAAEDDERSAPGRCVYNLGMRLCRQIGGPDSRGQFGPGCEEGTMS